MDSEKVKAAKDRVMQLVRSREAQGCLPIDGGTLTAHAALFYNSDSQDTIDAIFALVDEGVLSCDGSGQIDIKERTWAG